jgi:HPt (histidine-containing phosphotransfer) domain-containing protein
MTTTPPFDLSQLVDMYSGNMANVYMTATVFCDQLEQDLSIVKDKFDEGDYPAVKAFAHRMKPNLKLFGVLDLHELVIEIEKSALDANVPVLGPQLDTLINRGKDVIAALRVDIKNNN